MEEKDWGLLEEADWHFRKLVRRFVKERDKIAIEGISLPGMLILNTIMRDGEQRLGDLAEQLDFTSGAITAICDKLESLGYAIRKRSDTDRRTVSLDITDSGKEMICRNRSGTYMIETIFGAFTEAELKVQIDHFKRLHEHLEGFAEAVLQQARSSSEEAAVNPESRLHKAKRSNQFLSY
ncbi:winged helix DNA-binding protein [Paenibacillus sp. HJL G12]|uniref:Winged helix DNA-binding protein n=1 Tax=Paenibacillus dendrobii TaxID=2691084 RepID=A0A7X3IFB8_9BACL|nr:MarR family transcriptional regulator [Paenibacillus dendrobii]MWV42858.1 winged helix DNA-binding protein [Paenibacillus dendrobii]